jgi:hypothetical protein
MPWKVPGTDRVLLIANWPAIVWCRQAALRNRVAGSAELPGVARRLSGRATVDWPGFDGFAREFRISSMLTSDHQAGQI